VRRYQSPGQSACVRRRTVTDDGSCGFEFLDMLDRWRALKQHWEKTLKREWISLHDAATSDEVAPPAAKEARAIIDGLWEHREGAARLVAMHFGEASAINIRL
jgi:hypothetical protein